MEYQIEFSIIKDPSFTSLSEIRTSLLGLRVLLFKIVILNGMKAETSATVEGLQEINSWPAEVPYCQLNRNLYNARLIFLLIMTESGPAKI